MNWLYFSNNHNEFTTVWPEYDETSNEKFAWIHWSSAQLRFHHILVGLYFFPLFTLNSLSFRKITINSLSALSFRYEYTICFAIVLWIYYLFVNLLSIESTIFLAKPLLIWRFTFNSRSASRFHYEFTISFANLPWTHYLIPEITRNSPYLLRDFTMNWLYISGIHFHLFR